MKKPDLLNRLCKRLSGKIKAFSLLISFLFVLFFGNISVFAQVLPDYEVIEGVDPIVMVQQILIGSGVQTSNISYTGNAIARGTFSGQSNLNIESGIILTSGRGTYSEGPNNAAGKSYDANSAGDAALTQLCGSNTNDASVLEFDFIPQSNIVEFKYVFGSEEYPEYVNQFNDVFGFFISGPDIFGPYPSPPGFPNGARNIALVPRTLPQTIVSIDNINNGSSNNGPCTNCQYYVNNGTGNTPNANLYIQYDGFTTVLIARSNVVPCETYHIKLAVADAGDDAYDTGVFLEANSFSSVGLGANLAFTHAAVDTAVEACNNAAVAFELFQITPVDYTINLEIGGTAENGVDYELIPDQIIIPMGDTMAVLPINAIDDGIYEYITETVTLIFNSSLCGVDMDTLTVYIKDYPILGSIASGDQTMVCGETRKLQAAAYGGIPPYFYEWSTGETTDTLDVSPTVSTTYTVTVTDECGSQKIETIEVTVLPPVAYAGEDIPICQFASATLIAEGGTSWLWMPGGLTDNTIVVSPNTTTTYTLTSYDACGNSSTDEVTVFVDEPFADAGPDTDICLGQTITLTANDTPGGVWTWTDMTTMTTYNGRSIMVSPPDSRQYCVEVTDNCGNTLTDCVDVTVLHLTAVAGPDQLIIYGTPTTLNGSVMLGTGPYTFQWEPSDKLVSANVQNPTTLNLYEPTVFTLFVTDLGTGCVCQQPDSVTVSLDGFAIIAFPSAQPDTVCSGSSATLFTMPAGGTSNYTYQWTSDPPGFTSTLPNPEVSPSATTDYTVLVNDGYNSANATITINVNQLPQVNLLPPYDPDIQVISPTSPVEIAVCVFDTVTLNAGNPGSIYLWSNGSDQQSIDILTSGLSVDIQEYDVTVTNPVTGCSNSAGITTYFTFINCSYGIDDNAINAKLMVYPNPSGDGLFSFNIEGLDGEILLEVFNSQGIFSFKEAISVVAGNTYNSSVNLSQHAPGIYFLKLTYNEGTMLRKLIIQK